MDEVRHHFGRKNFHIIAVTETWLKTELSDQFVALQGYSVVRNDRLGRLGRGAAVYYRFSCLSVRVLVVSDSDPYTPKFLIAELLTTTNIKILLDLVYRPTKVGHLNIFECTF